MIKKPVIKKSLFNPVYFDIKYYCPICKDVVGVSDKKQETILIVNPTNHLCYQSIRYEPCHGTA